VCPMVAPPPSMETEGVQNVRVLTVDDQPTFRRAARELIDDIPEFESVGEAADGAEALDAIPQLHPELVLLDLRMPGMNGIETARHIRARHPDVAVVIVSAEDPEDYFAEALGCGAAAMVRKQDLCPRRLSELWASVRRAAVGQQR
jgi:two-component system invasion response regulator UvrY